MPFLVLGSGPEQINPCLPDSCSGANSLAFTYQAASDFAGLTHHTDVCRRHDSHSAPGTGHQTHKWVPSLTPGPLLNVNNTSPPSQGCKINEKGWGSLQPNLCCILATSFSLPLLPCLGGDVVAGWPPSWPQGSQGWHGSSTKCDSSSTGKQKCQKARKYSSFPREGSFRLRAEGQQFRLWKKAG